MSLPLTLTPRVAVCILTLACALLARYRPAWRPVAITLLTLAAIELARLVTYPRAAEHAFPWWSLDAGLLVAWVCALAISIDKRWLPCLVAVPVFAVARPYLHDETAWSLLRASRVALTLPLAIGVRALLSAPSAHQAAPLVLAAGCVAGLLGTWADDPPGRWWVTYPLSYGAYGVVAALMVWSGIRRQSNTLRS